MVAKETTLSSLLGTVETRSFPAVPSPSLAVETLSSAPFSVESKTHLLTPLALFVSKTTKPSYYFQKRVMFMQLAMYLKVPIQQKIEAIDWLYAQNKLLPRCYFSDRAQTGSPKLSIDCANGNGNGNGQSPKKHNKLVSVAGVGSAVFFQDLHPFSYRHWKSLKRFLSTECPLIPGKYMGQSGLMQEPLYHPEWEAFGYFYFMVPQVEFDELEDSSILATNIAWDNSLSWTLGNAIDELKATMHQISSIVLKLQKQVCSMLMLSNSHIPSKKYWDLAVNRALQKIRSDSALIKVVLARSSRVITATDIDPIAWLACLQVEGKNAYQFCLQPPDAPAFIGNTSNCFTEHGLTSIVKLWLEPVPEFEILSSLHPSPAVCGFPTEEARVLIAETEVFDRGMYAGPVGWFWRRRERGLGALIYAGTGVVEGSNASSEWDELELKISQFTKLLKLEVPLEIKS
ncbi:hypothetical protein J5N97_000237 [Dioscorea zingiberensis]|uniref:Chorismate-utilising enzyme C-terminal domain-containing protein n=1 Tax=Dioscorea zingiberensis TaxID=325984 RepID=A0A9D5BSS9_9LILI|nr:hypothetical protein J5N97_000237 [Dioscorea zingiberensis]